jgi:hypothetical protein
VVSKNIRFTLKHSQLHDHPDIHQAVQFPSADTNTEPVSDRVIYALLSPAPVGFFSFIGSHKALYSNNVGIVADKNDVHTTKSSRTRLFIL